jgi:hypothetical protein
VAIVIRPSTPPTITFGNGTDAKTDPLLRVKLLQASFDFYIFSLDRFVRFMTATFDLDVPVNLAVTPDGLLPQIKKLGVTNGKVSNNDLIRENADDVALALGSVIEGFAGQAVGAGLKPIDLNASLSSLGLKLIIPETVDGKGSAGLRKLSKGSDNYLGLFASFGLPNAQPKKISTTSARLVHKTVDPTGLVITTMRADNAPVASLRVSSPLDDGTRAIEYTYRVDQGPWSPFTRDRDLDIRDEWLRVQGKHVIGVRSRIVGDAMSLDPNPAEVTVVVDVDAPTIKIGKIENGKAALTVRDRVSEDRSMVRVKLDDNAWSEWQLASSFQDVAVGEASSMSIEAKDEEGNVATAQQALIRGRAIAAAGGCGCAVAGDDQAPRGTVWLLGVAIAGIGARLFGKKRAAKAAKVASAPRAGRRTLGSVARAYAVPAVTLAFASTWAGCNCGVETTPAGTSTTGGCPTCQTLEPGLIGAYTSVAVAGSTVWVAGYSEADWENGMTYGDLVVGKWNDKDKKVDWEFVDGVPADPPPDPKSYNVDGFRGGQTESGDDVGIWTSLAIDSAGNPAVAYYDRSNKVLKFAHHDGKAWTVSTVEGKASADIGRYAKLLAQNGGFVLAYQSVEAGGDNGAALAKVRVATAASDKVGAEAWTFEDAVVAKNTPCRANFCASGTACVAATKLCTKTSTACDPACASGSSCVDDNGAVACAPIFDANKIDAYPDAVGDYISIAAHPKGGIGIAYYDRPAGDLYIASKAGGTWSSLLVDGSDAAGNDTGDVGIGASLFIDAAGTYHLTYVDGLTEAVRYVQVADGKTVGKSEIVDDGLTVGAAPFEDGQHLVGDDSHLTVTPSGEVRVTYQDATAGTLHYAVGVGGADKHTWTVKVVPQDGFAGAFSSIIEVDGKLQLVNWWRTGGKKVAGDVALVAP